MPTTKSYLLFLAVEIKSSKYFNHIISEPSDSGVSSSSDNKYIFDYVDIKRKDVMRMIRRDTIGKVVWNNVRYTYKVNKREHEKEYLEDAIDYGFLMLNWMNVLKVVYSNNKPLLLKS